MNASTKARLIRGKSLAYGALWHQNAYPSESKMHKLQTCIVEALGATAARRCNALVFTTASHGDDLDPHVQQCGRRADLFRRMWLKHPTYRYMAKEVFRCYATGEVIFKQSTDLKDLQVAPPLDSPGRKDWKPPARTNGPIGYLLSSIAQIGAAMDSQFVVHRFGENEVRLCSDPKKHVHTAILSLACNAREIAVAGTRSDLKGMHEIDKHVLQQCQKGLASDDLIIYNYLSNLCGLSLEVLHGYGQAASTVCQFCKHPQQKSIHLLWFCLKFGHIRDRFGLDCTDFDAANIPNTILLGIPLALGVCSQNSFSGQHHRRFQAKADFLGCFNTGRAMLTNVRDKLSTFAHTCPQLNARQMFIHSRGFQHRGPLPPPPQCSEEAPAEPNGFSDGGLFSPSNPQWTYGSHGIHWPTESPRGT